MKRVSPGDGQGWVRLPPLAPGGKMIRQTPLKVLPKENSPVQEETLLQVPTRSADQSGRL